ncbi:PREDICTED: uncharacterized protein LOC104607049 [Nelumbo nucifera]|uniref:Uncharacterized protein LOC104607049 n=1 Tax=Nelumbo nucifera TaxID=4432 RepID=A0A1U8B4X4_NELNU|nr:PREDICTED: uncharacterized protein LOC104607049 [Nelumbo nucifera]
MEVLLRASFATPFSSTSSKCVHRERVLNNHISCLIFGNGVSSLRSFFPQELSIVDRGRKSVISEAKKKNKVDSHSFIPKPDEATGIFPEAVLLKEKKVQEDGRVLPEFADAEEEELFEFLNLQMESQLNVERMRHYEVVYLIHEDHVEEVDSVTSKVEEFIREKKGKIWRLNDWGLRRLAYKIKKASYAKYILMNFELEAKWINDFKSILDKDERVIRHLVIKRDKAITEDCPPPPEFHTLRAGMDDDEIEMDYDDAYEDEEDGDYLEDEGELNMIDYDDDIEDGIILVDDENDNGDEGRHTNHRSASLRKGRKQTLKAGKVAR